MLEEERATPSRDGGNVPSAPLQEPQTEREIYFNSLRLWIQQAQMYQNLSTCFPYYMMTLHGFQNHSLNGPLLNNNYQIQGQPWPFHIQNPNLRNVTPTPNRPADEALTAAEVISRHGGYEYVIPPLYKRVLAELIDFVLLFVLKLVVMFIAVDVFDFIDMEKFDIYKISENLEDYKLAIELTSEILFLEFIYRVLVCFFEACCLSGVVGAVGVAGAGGRAGGATPGKALLGLRVVSAGAVVAVEGRARDTVLVHPGRALGLGTALARSLLKNMLISLLFPLCLVVFVFRHNRTGYDLACRVIVVEENLYPPRRHAP